MASARAHSGNLGRLAVGMLAVAAAVGTFVIAEGPGEFTTYGGVSVFAAVISAVAGLMLVVAGLVTSASTRTGSTGNLALLAGLLWTAPVLVGWEEGPSLVRSLGMLLSGFTFPFVFHLAVGWPGGQLRSSIDRLMVRGVYITSAISAMILALLRHPFFDPNCWANCTVNDFLLRSQPTTARLVQTIDRWIILLAAAALIGVCVWRVSAATRPARFTLAPVAIPAALFSAATGAHALALLAVPREAPRHPRFFSIFIVGCISLILLGAGLVWIESRMRGRRKAVARIVTDLGKAPPPGSLESALGLALGDPELRLAYWLDESQRYIDAMGRSVPEPTAVSGRAVTTLMRGDQRVAVVSHTAIPDMSAEIGAAVRLALENERLQAELLAQLEELRSSRARIVATGDAERRSLERDLHDGAQQRLLTLSYEIRGAQASAEADGHPDTGAILSEATEEAHAALEELRDLAHGIYPAILAESGLASALATYADGAPVPVEIRIWADGRFPADVEMAIYLLVTGATEDAATRGASCVVVSAVRDRGRLAVAVEDDGDAHHASPPVALADRIGAIGGTLKVEPARLIAELQCE